MTSNDNFFERPFHIMEIIHSFLLLLVFYLYPEFHAIDSYRNMHRPRISANFKFGKIGDWPNLKLYYFKAPVMFNDNLLRIMNLTNHKTSIDHHFLIEIYLRDLLKRVPILTNNISEADLVYIEYFPSLDYLTFIKGRRNRKSCLYPKLLELIRKNNIPDEKVLIFAAFPIIGNKCLNSSSKLTFIGSIEKRNDRPRDFIIPYHTHFDQYPIEKYREDKVKKDISLILAGSLISKRMMYIPMIKRVPNSKIVAIDRSKKSVHKLILSIPELYAKSTFCLVPAGDSPSSKRLYDGLSYDCIPIILSDDFILPFEGTVINWNEISIKVLESEYETIPAIISNFSVTKLTSYHQNIRHEFEKLRFDNGVSSNSGIGSIFWHLYIKYFR